MPIIGKDIQLGTLEQLSRLKLTIEEEFPGIWKPTEACLSVIAQLKISDISNCFFLTFVGPPSTRKTTMLSWFFGLDDICYRSDEFSPHSFVSHYAGSTKEKLKEVDLLPRIKDKVLITPELLPIFNASYEVLLENLGIITRVLDAQGYTSDSGVHGRRGYEGAYVFHWLGAIAYIPHRIWSILGNLGPRAYFYLMPQEKEKTAEELSEEIKEEFEKKSKICQNAVHSFINNLWDTYPAPVVWLKEKDDTDAMIIIARMAQLLSKLRGNIEYQKVVEPDEEGNETEAVYTQPIVEEPHRANQVLYNLARGHALICGRKYITKDDLPLVIKVALNSANTDRVKLFEFLLNNNGLASSKDFENYLNCSRAMAIRTMTSLKILGLVDSIKGNPGEEGGRPMYYARLRDNFKWFISREFKSLWKD
jgi:predicted transcriptional regulator